jgi:hypothetical protein
MLAKPVLKPGTWVRLRSASHALDLTSDSGRIVRPDELAGYYIVRLDRPAVYHGADGDEQLYEIREAVDNLEVIREG